MDKIILLLVSAILVYLVAEKIITKFSSRRADGALRSESEEKIAALKEEWRHNLQGITQQVNQRLDNTAALVGGIENQLGKLEEATKRVYEVGSDIARLEEILRAPKIRGEMGEFFLENLLDQIMPGRGYFEMQHQFKSGERVDAVIRIGEKLVPVDSKFPLENFRRIIEAKSEEERIRAKKEFVRRDLRKHIDEIADKYILPEEGTYDFALMYIPAENVYYEAVIKEEVGLVEMSVAQYALSRKVIPVSPNTFYAYLQVIIFGLRGMEVEKQTRLIIERISALQGEFARFKKSFEVAGSHLSDARNRYEDAARTLTRFEDKLIQIEEPTRKQIKKSS